MTAEQTKIAEESHVKAPWLNVYGVVPPHLDYPDCTMYEAVERCAETYPNHTAYVFMGRKTTYRAMAAEIDLCARALKENRISSEEASYLLAFCSFPTSKILHA